MDGDIPQEIKDFLLQSGLDDRKIETMRLNIINSFSNPKIIGSMISFHYPKLLHHDAISDSNSTSLRLEQWRKLNKTLAIIRCELTEERIIKFGNRKCTKEEIYAFYTLLKVKLDAYEPQYLAKSSFSTISSAKTTSPQSYTSKVTAITTSLSSTSIKPSSPNRPKTSEFDESMEILQSLSAFSADKRVKVKEPTMKATIFGNAVHAPVSKLLASGKSLTVKYQEEIPPVMPEEQMETTFQKLSTKLKENNQALTREVDELQNKSDSLHNKLLEMRSQNKEELKKTESRIKSIQHELEDLKIPSSRDISVSMTAALNSSGRRLT